MPKNKIQLRYVIACEMGVLNCMVLEGEGAGRFFGRFDLNWVRKPQKMSALAPEDRQLLMQLYMVQSLNGSRARLTGGAGFKLLRRLSETGRCYWERGDGPRLEWSEETMTASLGWRMEGGFEPCLTFEDHSAEALPLTPAVWVRPETGAMGELTVAGPAAAAQAWLAGGFMSEAESKEFSRDIARRFPELDFPSAAGKAKRVRNLRGVPRLQFAFAPPRPPEGTALPNGEFVAAVEFVYGAAVFPHDAPVERMTVVGDTGFQRIYRNEEAEEERMEELRAAGFVLATDLGPGFSWVRPVNGVVFAPELDAGNEPTCDTSQRFAEATAALRKAGWQLLFEKRELGDAPPESKWFARLRSQTGKENWFEFEAGVRVGRKNVNLLPLLRELLAKWRGSSLEQIRGMLLGGPVLVKVDADRAVPLPGARLWSIVEKLFELYDERPLTKQGRVKVDSWRAAELADLPGMTPEQWNGFPRVRSLVDTLRAGLNLSDADPPAGFVGELRDYQRRGLAWLDFLRSHAVHGILADDMGLGKTVQTLAHLLAEKRAGRLPHPALIVAPTSLMNNWREEAEQFTPDLRCVVFHGADRRERWPGGEADLVFTTYALLRIDQELFREQRFSYLVLDEAQAIKNAKSQAGRVARGLTVDRRLCLTGTPMENHLGELWSLFDFLMPGFLGDLPTFNRRYRDPIEKLGQADRQTWLRGRVAPFLLRRTKDEVAAELPPKTEVVHRVDLTEAQRDLYETVRLAMDGRVRDEIANKGLSRSHIVIFDALLKLRQICCDPRLLSDKKRKLKSADSAKLTGLMDLLPEMIDEGRSVLLFSQFTSMLKLIEREVERAKIPFVKLTGSTTDRATPIKAFQNGDVRLFLISLKAGGAGLNLTAADTVIHYDPWWNPAVERQATDRAHRIGQDKPVFVYKLLAQGTVEEKIQSLQSRKAELAEGILSGSLRDRLTFSEEDLRDLFG